MGRITMLSKDAVSGAMAELYVTIGNNHYNFGQAITFETTFEKNKTEIPILGRTGKGHKAAGWSGSGSMTVHYNTSVMRELALKYKETGEDTYFTMQCTNEDPTSSVGRQTIIYKDCNFDSLILSKFDADAEYLDEDIDFTFDDFEMPETFNTPSWMR